MTRYAPSLPTRVLADGGRLRQVLTNLVGNAIKFTKEGHVLVEVSGEEKDGALNCVIAIEDTGCGIPQDKLGRIFRVFEQVDGSATRQHEGTGLGLSISSRMVALMGGEIGVRSVKDEGSTFTLSLTLPLSEEAPLPDVAVSGEALQGKRILVVDDLAVNRTIIAEQLSSWGIEPVLAAGAAEAREAIAREAAAGRPLHAAVLDYQMPDTDGLTLASELREDEASAALPLILLTSVGHIGDAPNFESYGFAAYLVKPAKRDALIGAVRTALGRPGLPAAAAPEGGAPPQPKTLGRKLRILVVEDNRVNRMVIQAMLADGGYDIEIAEDGQVAVDRYPEVEPDIVLMDVSMPRMDGLTATRRIREIEGSRPAGARSRIIGITAHALPEDRQKCFDNGMDDYLPKPVAREALQEALARAAAG